MVVVVVVGLTSASTDICSEVVVGTVVCVVVGATVVVDVVGAVVVEVVVVAA